MNKKLYVALAVAAFILGYSVFSRKTDPYVQEVLDHDSRHAVVKSRQQQQATPDSLLERELKDDEK